MPGLFCRDADKKKRMGIYSGRNFSGVQYGDLPVLFVLCDTAQHVWLSDDFAGGGIGAKEAEKHAALSVHGADRCGALLCDPADSFETAGKRTGYLSGDQFDDVRRRFFRDGKVLPHLPGFPGIYRKRKCVV